MGVLVAVLVTVGVNVSVAVGVGVSVAVLVAVGVGVSVAQGRCAVIAYPHGDRIDTGALVNSRRPTEDATGRI